MKIPNALKLTQKKLIILACVSFLLLSGIGIFVATKHDANNEAKRIAAFEVEKSKKLAAIIAENKRISDEAVKKENEEHEKLQNLIDSGSLTTSDVKNNCKRLKDREAIVLTNPVRCDYKLVSKGNVKMAVVFIGDGATNYDYLVGKFKGTRSSNESLAYINAFMKREAARNNNPNLQIDMQFYGPYTQINPLPAYDTNLSQYQDIVDTLQGTSIQNKVPESEYDIVHYVHLVPYNFRSFAMPERHRAFTSMSGTLRNNNTYYEPVIGTFIHETLHLFGASDKYNNGDCQSRGLGDPFNPNSSQKNLTDIMCNSHLELDLSNINTITAREIGWLN